MRGSENQSGQDFSRYDTLSTEELGALLRLYLEASDDKTAAFDDSVILYIMEVLAKREAAAPSGRFTDADTAWKTFETRYMPFLSDDKPLENADEENELDEVTCKTAEVPPIKPARSAARKSRKALRVILVAAILLVALIIGAGLTASAMGYRLWDGVAQWTENTFGFKAAVPPEASGKDPAAMLLAARCPEAERMPTWVPDEYHYEKTEEMKTPQSTIYTVVYTCPEYERPLLARINLMLEPSMITFEKDDDPVLEYMAVGFVTIFSAMRTVEPWCGGAGTVSAPSPGSLASRTPNVW